MEGIMGHNITLPSNCSIAVVDMDGAVLSTHRTTKAAQAEIDRENRAFRRRGNTGGSWLPRSIIDATGWTIPRSPRGLREVFIERCGPHSTRWQIVA